MLNTLFLIYWAIFIVGSLKSYKFCICMIWASLLLVPTIIISLKIEYAIFLSLIICMFNQRNRIPLKTFFFVHQKAIIVFLMFSISTLVLSEVVPIRLQTMTLRHDFLVLILIIETFLLCKDYSFSQILLKIVCICVALNILYSVIFEIILGFNPAGLPLYVFMGLESNEYLVDMIDQERGIFDFRLQSIFGHPLSLGQYFLVLVPVLFLVKKKLLSLFFVFHTDH